MARAPLRDGLPAGRHPPACDGQPRPGRGVPARGLRHVQRDARRHQGGVRRLPVQPRGEDQGGAGRRGQGQAGRGGGQGAGRRAGGHRPRPGPPGRRGQGRPAGSGDRRPVGSHRTHAGGIGRQRDGNTDGPPLRDGQAVRGCGVRGRSGGADAVGHRAAAGRQGFGGTAAQPGAAELLGAQPGRLRGESGKAKAAKSATVSGTKETPRNAPCPCGSGKKYKFCHGASAG
ncbi:SEC-C metal-binding domain-containing protein [Blastococcus brunescens]|uniref:SEC-C metal-binding domain-containing protein n=1 Tax=Blastococcus brunescens TaxID=1564165 RepID=A0ABZ1BB60_9ACTN|nr:SEC-C metal-binding domain-containing protein [Blastococcus sp. BMG 8361]WRL67126.1 SEC-C metal-binding domain-containing protein [Blastococcus sp. BMG 8361]